MATPTTTESILNYTTIAMKSKFQMAYGPVLAAAVVEILVCLVGTVGNLFTIVAVARNRNLQYATNYLIVSLSIADILVCTILVPMRASQHIAYQYDSTIPKGFVVVAGFVGRVNIIASISTLVCLSCDRYLALSRPLRYSTSIRYCLWKVSVVIVVIWSVAIFITSLPKFPGVSDTPFLIFFVAFVLTATLVICIMYYKIFRIIARSVRQIGKPLRFSKNFEQNGDVCEKKDARKSRTLSSSNQVCVVNSDVRDVKNVESLNESAVSGGPSQDPRGISFSREERKAAKTVGLVIAAFILLVYPRIIMILYHFRADESSSSTIARFWMRVFLYCNSAVNPAFYAYRHRGFRREFKKMGLQLLGLGQTIRERYSTIRGQDRSRSSTVNTS